jgi:hypothetical protein
MFNCIIFFTLGIILGNISEYIIHKYILHDLGKSKKSFFSAHWHRHHRTARRNDFYDQNYKNIKNNKLEIMQLIFLIALFFPLKYIHIFLFLGGCFNALMYFILHRYMHLNPLKAKKYFRWHWEHHMGKNQDENWCVTLPLTDFLLKLIKRK